jgi:hypothetical protein
VDRYCPPLLTGTLAGPVTRAFELFRVKFADKPTRPPRFAIFECPMTELHEDERDPAFVSGGCLPLMDEEPINLPDSMGLVTNAGQAAREGEGTVAKNAREVSRRGASVLKSQEKKGEDKEEEKIIEKLYKKSLKELKDQLEGCSGDEKVKLLEKRCLEKLRDFNKLERANSRLHQLFDNLQLDMDNVTQELTKIKSVKDKLEALCKQLQKQNKQILDDCKQTALEDKERKREQQDKFSLMIQVSSSSIYEPVTGLPVLTLQ